MVVKVGKSDIILILSLHPHNVPGRLVFVAIYWCFLCPFNLCGTLLWRDNLLGFGLSHHEDNLLKFELNHLIPTTKYKHDTSFQSFCIAFLEIFFLVHIDISSQKIQCPIFCIQTTLEYFITNLSITLLVSNHGIWHPLA